MNFADLLSPQRTLACLPCSSKKRALEKVSQWLAQSTPGVDAEALFGALIEREKLGSTGFGNGVAIPHCRLAACREPMAALVRLEQQVDFDAIDGAPVDLLFILLVPQDAHNEHLQVLAALAQRLNQADYRAALRQAVDDQALYQAAAH